MVEIRDFGDEAAKVVLYPHDDLRIIENKAAYLHKDQLGSVRVVTDDLGEKENTFAYTPFGEQKNWPHKVTTHREEKSYIGQRYDQDAGLLYLNARYMDPALGLFVQPDWFEISRPGVGLNRYSYALNDPVNLMDPRENDSTPVDLFFGVVILAGVVIYGIFASTPDIEMPDQIDLGINLTEAIQTKTSFHQGIVILTIRLTRIAMS